MFATSILPDDILRAGKTAIELPACKVDNGVITDLLLEQKFYLDILAPDYTFAVTTESGICFFVSAYQTVRVFVHDQDSEFSSSELVPGMFLSKSMRLTLVNFAGEIVSDRIQSIEFDHDNRRELASVSSLEVDQENDVIIFIDGLGVMLGNDQREYYDPAPWEAPPLTQV